MTVLVTDEMVENYRRDGCVLVKGLWANWVDTIAQGIDQNMDEPGPYAAENLLPGEGGRFFDDYCNWQRIPAFEKIARDSDVADVAATLMGSDSAQLFHDHVLVKEPGTSKQTPWHQDSPYYFVEGEQTISFGHPSILSQMRHSAGCGQPQVAQACHANALAEKDSFYPNEEDYMPVPDPDAEGMRVLEWAMEPGDAVAFDYRVLHGARGIPALSARAFSLRLVGDDARYVERPGRTSPPFPGHDMEAGQRLREDWFPVLR